MKGIPTTGRPCRGRAIAWSMTVNPWGITVRAFKRDSTGRSFMAADTISTTELKYFSRPRTLLAVHLLAMRAQVRWAVDQVEFARLGLIDPTPKPSASWPSDLPEFIADRSGIDTRYATETWEPGQ